MKTFTKEEIEKWTVYCEKIALKKVDVKKVDAVSGEELKFSYYVLPSNIASLPKFILRISGKNQSEGYVLALSEDVPEKFRVYPMVHEFTEFIKIGIDKKNRCRDALEAELKLAREEIPQELPDYIEMRKDFFKNFLDYAKSDIAKNGQTNYNDSDINEFSQAYTELIRLSGIEKQKRESKGPKSSLESIVVSILIFGVLGLLYYFFSKPNVISAQNIQLAPPFPNYAVYVFAMMVGGASYFLVKRLKK